MKKAVVFNDMLSYLEPFGCSSWRKSDYEKFLMSKKVLEKMMTDRFNSESTNGYEFDKEKVYLHNLFVSNEFVERGIHGVYSFENSETKPKYNVSFGPVVHVEEQVYGCKFPGLRIGCKLPSFKVGCNFKNIGCNSKNSKSIGCSSKGGNKQYINFFNDQINEDEVQKLNKYFGLRASYLKEVDDNIFEYLAADSYEDKLQLTNDYSEVVKMYKDEVLDALSKEMQEFKNAKLGVVKVIDTPSSTDEFSQAILLSDQSTDFVNSESLMNPTYRPSSSSRPADHTTYVSGFEVWYFTKVKGLLAKLWDLIKKLLKMITFGLLFKGDDEIVGTSIIEDDNLKILERVYTDELTAQEEGAKQAAASIEEYNKNIEKIKLLDELFADAYLGKLPVTLAIHKKCWGVLTPIHDFLFNKQYEFHVLSVDAFKDFK